MFIKITLFFAAAIVAVVAVVAIAQPDANPDRIPAAYTQPATLTVLDMTLLRTGFAIAAAAPACSVQYVGFGSPPILDRPRLLFTASGSSWDADGLARLMGILIESALPELPSAAWELYVMEATTGDNYLYCNGNWSKVAD